MAVPENNDLISLLLKQQNQVNRKSPEENPEKNQKGSRNSCENSQNCIFNTIFVNFYSFETSQILIFLGQF